MSGLLATIAREMHEGIDRELDASIGAPGRCDFIVLPNSFVRAQPTRCEPTGHRIPASRVVTIARKRPSE